MGQNDTAQYLRVGRYQCPRNGRRRYGAGQGHRDDKEPNPLSGALHNHFTNILRQHQRTGGANGSAKDGSLLEFLHAADAGRTELYHFMQIVRIIRPDQDVFRGVIQNRFQRMDRIDIGGHIIGNTGPQ